MKNNLSYHLKISIFGYLFTFIILMSLCFAESGIKIIEPLAGTVVTSGEEMVVVVEAVEGFELDEVLVGPPFDVKTLSTAPFVTSFTIPTSEIGSIKIRATGKSFSKQFVTDEIIVNVHPNAPLQSLSAGILQIRLKKPIIERNFLGLILSEEHGSIQINVEGVYSDGIRRDLKFRDAGTTYVSHDPAVVTVDENGLVTVQGIGTTTITVSNSGISTEVPVTVQKKWVSLAKETIPPKTEIDIVPPANGAGWYNHDLTVTLTATDNEGGSGVKEIYHLTSGAVNQRQTVTGDTATVQIAAEGTTVLAYYATDNAGNAEAEQTAAFKLDKTPPAVIMPDLDPTYIYNSTLSFSYNAMDALSGVGNIAAAFNGVSISNGDTVTLNKLGANAFKVEAVDIAGNAAARTVNLDVRYIFSGFLPPVAADGSGVYKLGRTIPIKFQLRDGNQVDVSTASAVLAVQQFSEQTPVGPITDVASAGDANTGNKFRYDAEDQQYIFNLSTTSLSPGTWQLQARLDDGSVQTGFIQLK